MSRERNTPERFNPLDGLNPTDFVGRGRWPDGELTVPSLLKARGLTPQQITSHVTAMFSLRQLARDYRRYVGETETTNEMVAAKLGLSVGALRNVRTGAALPSARTLLLLRSLVPTQEQMNAGDYRDELTRSRERSQRERPGRSPQP